MSASHPEFRKSSHSAGGESGTCVELAMNLSDAHLVRDSKDPHGPTLSFRPNELSAFVAEVKAGRYDR